MGGLTYILKSIRLSYGRYKPINKLLFWIAVGSIFIAILSVKWALDSETSYRQTHERLNNLSSQNERLMQDNDELKEKLINLPSALAEAVLLKNLNITRQNVSEQLLSRYGLTLDEIEDLTSTVIAHGTDELEIGNAFYFNSRYNEAIYHYNLASASGERYGIEMGLGLSYLGLLNSTKSRSHFFKAIELSNNSLKLAFAESAIGDSYVLENNFTVAFQHYRNASELSFGDEKTGNLTVESLGFLLEACEAGKKANLTRDDYFGDYIDSKLCEVYFPNKDITVDIRGWLTESGFIVDDISVYLGRIHTYKNPSIITVGTTQTSTE